MLPWILLVMVSFLSGGGTTGQDYILTPPYFNIAENRPITANATCGERRGERFCKLVGYDILDEDVRGKEIVDGQVNNPQNSSI